MSDTVAVIASVRKFDLEFLRELNNTDVIIVDDSPEPRMDRSLMQPDWHRANWMIVDRKDRLSILPPQVDTMIPIKSPSCKNVGLYIAHQAGYKTVMILDDDCDTRASPDFVRKIPIGKTCLYRKVTNSNYGKPTWYNPMRTIDKTQYSRGFPYAYRSDHYKKTATNNIVPAISMFNEGLWINTPDTNGIDKFYKEDTYLVEERPQYNVLVDQSIYVPISIMNIQMHSKLLPAFYQPPDYHVYDKFYVRRHDDVWSGMFLKRLMDLAGDSFTIGEPVIYHDKKPDPTKETVAEHMTNFVQMDLQKVMDRAIGYVLPSENYKMMAIEFSRACQRVIYEANDIFYGSILANYFGRTCAWASFF